MRNSLLLSDLHLTSALRDAYRWKVFKQIADFAKDNPVERVFILGDLTDAKDYHASTLVNRVVDALIKLRSDLTTLKIPAPQVYILRGNHDGIDPEWPYFKFLSYLEGITFVAAPCVLPIFGQSVLFLPHSRNPVEEWDSMKPAMKSVPFVMLHATVKGSVSESGQSLQSEVTPAMFAKVQGRMYAGDVHVPQTVGKVTYIGSPYHVHYGDTFQPRMLYLDKMKERSVPLKNLRRWMFDVKSARGLHKLQCNPGDQAKVRLHVAEADLGKWQELRKEIVAECKALKLDLAGVELVREQSDAVLPEAHTAQLPEQVMAAYMKDNKTPPAVARVGEALLKIARNA